MPAQHLGLGPVYRACLGPLAWHSHTAVIGKCTARRGLHPGTYQSVSWKFSSRPDGIYLTLP